MNFCTKTPAFPQTAPLYSSPPSIHPSIHPYLHTSSQLWPASDQRKVRGKAKLLPCQRANSNVVEALVVVVVVGVLDQVVVVVLVLEMLMVPQVPSPSSPIEGMMIAAGYCCPLQSRSKVLVKHSFQIPDWWGWLGPTRA